MNHTTALQLAPWYVNGTLDERDTALLRREIAECADCANEVDALAAIAGRFRDARVAPPERVFENVMARVESGEPRARRLPRIPLFAGFPLGVRIAAGTAAALVCCVILVAALRLGIAPVSQRGGASLSEPAAMDQARPAAPEAAAKAVSAEAGAAGAVGGNAVQSVNGPVSGPQLIRTGSIVVVVADVDAAIRRVSTLAASAGGSLRSLTDDGADAQSLHRSAQLEIAVPKDRFETTIDAIGTLGTPRSRSIAAQDVSDQLVDAQARLTNLRREERDLAAIMDRSGRVSDILEVQQQLSAVREQIERLDAQLRNQRASVAYSAINVTLIAERGQSAAERGSSAQLAEAWHSATRASGATLVFLASSALWLTAFLPYVLIAAAIGYVVVRYLRRRSW